MNDFKSDLGISESGKLQTTLLSLGQDKTKEYTETEATELLEIPVIKRSDSARLLPKYTTILAKLQDGGISMDDLDQLQLDLEKLLSIGAIRIRYLLSEIGEIKNDDILKGKGHEKTSLKRKWPVEKPTFKDLKNGTKVTRQNGGLPINILDSLPQPEILKLIVPKNDSSDKFWTAIEPFCTGVTKDDLAFLDGIIQEFSKEIEINVPDLGEHYTQFWSEETVSEECSLSKSPSKKFSSYFNLTSSNINAMIDSFASQNPNCSKTLEERILNAVSKHSKNGATTTTLNCLEFKEKRLAASKSDWNCFDDRLKTELVKHGFLTAEIPPKNTSRDEIMSELSRCRDELATVNASNIEELKKLKSIASNELQSNELKERLDKVDKQILELYSKILIARKKRQQDEGENHDKIDQVIKEFEIKADALLKQQLELDRKINTLADTQTLY